VDEDVIAVHGGTSVIADCRLPIADCQLPMPIANFALPLLIGKSAIGNRQ
jgi:hypothetical protein